MCYTINMSELKIPNNFETPKIPESGIEKTPARPDFNLEKPQEGIEKNNDTIPSAPVAMPETTTLPPYQQRRKDIERTLSRGLEEIYSSMPPDKKAEFKKAGEETAVKINQILERTKLNFGRVVKLIRKWLALIPGVNKFFLEQEAKIRADEIVKIKL